MKLRGRLDRLAKTMQGDAGMPVTDLGWAAEFEWAWATGCLAGEPDFPRALAAYRAAIAAHPETYPPIGFEPERAAWDRQERCQGLHPRPAVDAARAWLAELYLRVWEGVPTVSEQEFEELAGWVQENQEPLRKLADRDGLVHLGDGTGAKISVLVRELPMGPCVPGAGWVAVIMRQLKARYAMAVEGSTCRGTEGQMAEKGSG